MMVCHDKKTLSSVFFFAAVTLLHCEHPMSIFALRIFLFMLGSFKFLLFVSLIHHIVFVP